MKPQNRNKILVQSRIDENEYPTINKHLLKKGLTFYTYIQRHFKELYLELKK